MSRTSENILGESSGLPMTPIIDIVLLLLIFFMLISRYLPPSLNVALPQAASASVDDRPAIAITIDAEGQLAVDGQTESWETLPESIAGHPPETQVRIAADKGTDYDYVVRAMDAAGQAGLVHIALETEAGETPVTPEDAQSDN